MLLILSQEYDPHADLVVQELQKRKAHFVRLNAEDLFDNIVGTFRLSSSVEKFELLIASDDRLDLRNFSMVYQRGFSVEHLRPYEDDALNRFFRDEALAFMNGLLFATNIRWFNHPFAVEHAAHKLHQLMKAQHLGFEVPETCVSNSAHEVQEFAHRHGMIIQKVLNRSRLRDDKATATLSYTRILSPSNLMEEARIAVLPSIYQSYIQKKQEVRITVVGESVVAVAIGSVDGEKRVDWRKGDLTKVPHVIHKLPLSVEKMCLQLVTGFGLRYGAIDMIITPDDHYVFLELNPEGLWGWLEILSEAKITNLLVDELLKT